MGKTFVPDNKVERVI